MVNEFVDGTFRQTNLKNESAEYLAKREALRLAEIELMQQRERVAAMRRGLPAGAALETVRPAAQAKGIAIEAALAPSGTVLGDAARLRQIFWNLLSNAVKFTPPGGRVAIGVERHEAYTEVTITDSGAGIAPDFLPVVFERFRQADSSPTREHGGLGLGLSIVRHLVELHGGSVSAHSDGVERGARASWCGCPRPRIGRRRAARGRTRVRRWAPRAFNVRPRSWA